LTPLSWTRKISFGLILFSLVGIQQSMAQEEPESESETESSYVHGDFQSDAQYYIYEPQIDGSQKVKEVIGNNSYLKHLV
jgi:hypothetical protein